MGIVELSATRQKTSEKEEIQQALDELNTKRQAWAALGIQARIDYLNRLKSDLAACMDDWVAAALTAKGGQGDPSMEAQEWLGGPYSVLRNLTLLSRSLSDVSRTGSPKLPGRIAEGLDGQLMVEVFPTDLTDKLLFMGSSAQVWLKQGVTEANIREHMAQAYQQNKDHAELCLVLCAGNVSSIGPMDCIYKLFNELKLCILKMHPVNAYLGPFFERMFASLIHDGFLRIVYGGADEGSYLCNHEAVDEIHITGSDKTHDIIVFGREIEARKARREPLLNKPITSELGNVSPVIIVPGPWRESDLAYHATNVISTLANNAGFNCNASRVLITAEGWPQRAQFLSLIEEGLRSLPTRLAYYTGAEQRYEQFSKAHPEAKQLGTPAKGHLPWMFVPDLDPNNRDDICFNTEAFCGVFGEVALRQSSTSAFLEAAARFANDTLWGTLNATLIIDPKTQKQEKDAFERTIADLRYGTVAVNQWAAVGYALGSTTWGAYPEHDIYDIKSGLDVVHNTYMFSEVEKSVLRCPFRQIPLPPYFVTNRAAGKMSRKLCLFESGRSLFRLPAVFISALGL